MESHTPTPAVYTVSLPSDHRQERGYRLWWARHALGLLVVSEDYARVHKITPAIRNTPAACDCADFRYRASKSGTRCAHLWAARYEAAERAGLLSRETAPAPGSGPAPLV